MIALMGLPGAGKSTLAALLSRKTGLPVISRDEIRARLMPESRYTAEEKNVLNAAVLRLVAQHLQKGEGCIIDGMTFARISEREAIANVAQKHHAALLQVFLDCPLELAVSRVSHGTHSAGDRSAGLVREVAARFEPVGDCALTFDARLLPERLCGLVERELELNH